MSIAETPGGGGFVRGHVGNTIRDQAAGRTPTDPVSHTTSVICCSIRMPSQRFLLWSTCVAVALVPAQAFLPVGQAPVASPPRPLYSTLQAPPKPTSATKIKQLKEEILSLVAVPEAEDNAEVQRMALTKRLDFLFAEIAKGYVPAQTVQFANLGLQGTWEHQFSSWRRRPADPDAKTVVAVTKVTQAMSPNITSGTILSKIFWRAVTAGEPAVDGRFEVSSSYMMNSKGVLEVTLEEQALYPNQAPKDPEGLIKGLQRQCPIDFFDPDQTFMETMFLDHEIRVVQTHSTRFGTITNFYVRPGSEAAKWIQEQQA